MTRVATRDLKASIGSESIHPSQPVQPKQETNVLKLDYFHTEGFLTSRDQAGHAWRLCVVIKRIRSGFRPQNTHSGCF